MRDKLIQLYIYLKDSWEDIPWIRAAGFIALTSVGLSALGEALPHHLSTFAESVQETYPGYILSGIVVLYFYLVSVFSGDKLRLEKQLRRLEQNFRYDNRGTLYNGGQPNIAFRIATFRAMLEGISENIDKDAFSKSLLKTGKMAGGDFANNLRVIYDRDVAETKSKLSWDELNFQQQLEQWAEYDSSTGWGILSCSQKKSQQEDEVIVKIEHLRGLFDGDVGILFSFFLGGYSETIISHILASYKNKKHTKYSEYNCAELLDEPARVGESSIELRFRLGYREGKN